MHFSIEYCEGEEREGFYVQSIMKRVWYAQLEVLKEIDRICKRHNIKYFAFWGTLLGQVRHQGFIPWDDDMDLAMLREDYERFRVYAEREVPAGWEVLSIHEGDWDQLLMRIVNTGYVKLEQEFLDRFCGCPFAVGVDIFVIDNIPQNPKEEEFQLELLSMVNTMGAKWNAWDELETDGMSREEAAENIEEVTGYHFDPEKPMDRQLLYLADKVSAMYYDAESAEVSVLCSLYKNSKFRFPVSCFEKIIEVPFENILIPIPEEYDYVLKVCYGDDYMTPVRWCSHDYPFFKNQINQLREAFRKDGQNLPECFDFK